MGWHLIMAIYLIICASPLQDNHSLILCQVSKFQTQHKMIENMNVEWLEGLQHFVSELYKASQKAHLCLVADMAFNDLEWPPPVQQFRLPITTLLNMIGLPKAKLQITNIISLTVQKQKMVGKRVSCSPRSTMHNYSNTGKIVPILLFPPIFSSALMTFLTLLKPNQPFRID